MAGNNSIQILRGTQSTIDASTQKALAGQPVYAKDTGYLYVGDGKTPIKDLEAIKASYADKAGSDGEGNNIAQQFANIEDGTTVVGAAESDEDGNNIVATYAKQNGSYPTFGAGRVVAAGRLEAGSDVNNCIPEEYEALYVWSCWSAAAIPGILNLPAGLTGTFYLTAYKTWEGDTADKYRLIQTIYECAGNRGIYQRSEDNVGGDGNIASPWQQLVYADGNYPKLGAGYLPNIKILRGTSNAGWYKIGSVDINDIGTGNTSLSVILFINGLYPDQNTGNTAGQSGKIEVDFRTLANGSGFDYARISISSGNLSEENICVTYSGTVAYLYYNLDADYESIQVIKNGECSNNTVANKKLPIFNFANTFYGTSAPSGAVYAVNRNYAADSDKLGGKAASSYFATQHYVTFAIPNRGTVYKSETASNMGVITASEINIPIVNNSTEAINNFTKLFSALDIGAYGVSTIAATGYITAGGSTYNVRAVIFKGSNKTIEVQLQRENGTYYTTASNNTGVMADHSITNKTY